MYCRNCGLQILEDSRFCRNCGKPQPIPMRPQNIILKTNPSSYALALELRKNFIILMISLLLGLFSFPICYFGIYHGNKYDKGGKPTMDELEMVYPDPEMMSFQYMDWHRIIEHRKEVLIEKSWLNSLHLFMISFVLIVIMRYLWKLIVWIDRNS